jgi:hypothetical protein
MLQNLSKDIRECYLRAEVSYEFSEHQQQQILGLLADYCLRQRLLLMVVEEARASLPAPSPIAGATPRAQEACMASPEARPESSIAR